MNVNNRQPNGNWTCDNKDIKYSSITSNKKNSNICIYEKSTKIKYE